MSDQLWQHGAQQLAEGIRDKTWSAAEAVDSVYNRIDAKNPNLNAIVLEDRDQARAAATRADAAVSSGQPLGRLHGVPVTIKTNVDVEGKPNSNGIPAFESNIAPANSPIVQNLLDDGAIIVGMTNTPEFSMRGTTNNPLYGLTHNPWGERMSPGGSSGGAGAAAAAGFGPIHHGNDIGGSLRFPSTACGVATVKPGQGRVASYNPSAKAERGMLSQFMSTQGIICRDVADVRFGMPTAVKHDPRDPWHVPMPFAGATPTAPLKVAYTKNAHGYPMHPDITANLERAANTLSRAGYIVEEVEPPPITEPAHGWFSVAILEIKLTLGPLADQYGSQTIRDIFENFYTMSDMVDLEGYFTGIAERTRMLREWSVFLNEYPLVLTPFLMQPTFDYDYDETYDGLKDLFDSAIYSFGLNYIGFPAGVVPAGLADGMPSGVQVVGQKFREDLILDALEVIETDVGVMSRRLWAND
jgi:amidase